jgi:hypothetical protein
MTDTLKPAELDLEALKKVALAAEKVAPGRWEADWQPYGENANGCDPAYLEGYEPTGDFLYAGGTVRLNNEDVAAHIATFGPAAVLSLLTRTEALEAEVRRLELSVLDAAISDRLDEAGSPLTWQEVALSAEAQLDRMREALEPFANIARVHLGQPLDDEHIVFIEDLHGFITELFVRPFRKALAALSQGSGEEG